MSRSSVGGRALVATTILAENGSLSCASCPTQLRHETTVTGYGTTNYGLTNRYVVNDIVCARPYTAWKGRQRTWRADSLKSRAWRTRRKKDGVRCAQSDPEDRFGAWCPAAAPTQQRLLLAGSAPHKGDEMGT